jgi:polysaccharide biosynthesis transport protein
LADVSARYTPKHPDVLRIKHQIAVAEKLKQELEANMKSAASLEDSGLGPAKSLADLQAISPMLQIEGQVKSNGLEIENRKQEVRTLERQIEAYQTHLNLTPVREQQLAAITRDHEQSRTNYESLLNKKMQSEMATNLEKRQEGEQFRIIDPPSLPQKPYSPDRFKLSLLGLLFGAVLSIGLTTFIENTDGCIYSDEDLLSVTPVPVLVAVPVLQTATEQQKSLWHRRLEFATVVLLVTLMPLITVFSYFRG